MPKSKPDEVILHRIELNNKERELLEQYLAGHTFKSIVIPTGVLVVAGGSVYVAYKWGKGLLGWGKDMVDDIQDMVEEGIGEAILGKKTYEDSEGKKYNNAFAGVPVLGSLMGAGINIGIATKDTKVANAYRNKFGLGSVLDLF